MVAPYNVDKDNADHKLFGSHWPLYNNKDLRDLGTRRDRILGILLSRRMTLTRTLMLNRPLGNEYGLHTHAHTHTYIYIHENEMKYYYRFIFSAFSFAIDHLENYFTSILSCML